MKLWNLTTSSDAVGEEVRNKRWAIPKGMIA
jgi:hypothetical protein